MVLPFADSSLAYRGTALYLGSVTSSFVFEYNWYLIHRNKLR